jgi:hypothetical protein
LAGSPFLQPLRGSVRKFQHECRHVAKLPLRLGITSSADPALTAGHLRRRAAAGRGRGHDPDGKIGVLAGPLSRRGLALVGRVPYIQTCRTDDPALMAAVMSLPGPASQRSPRTVQCAGTLAPSSSRPRRTAFTTRAKPRWRGQGPRPWGAPSKILDPGSACPRSPERPRTSLRSQRRCLAAPGHGHQYGGRATARPSA